MWNYTEGHKKEPNYFVCNFVQYQRIQFSMIDLEMNGICGRMNFTHLTELTFLHYLVKVKTPKMQ